MPKKVKPVDPGKVVKPWEGPLEYGVCESFLFDCWAGEHVRLSGTDIDFFSLDLDRSTVDPLYGEALERKWKGPFKLKGYLEVPSISPEVGEEGLSASFETSVWIARVELESKGAPAPAPQDIIRFWNTPFFNSRGVLDENVPQSGYFFSVTNIPETDGHIMGLPRFVGFKLEIKRETSMTAERLLLGK